MGPTDGSAITFHLFSFFFSFHAAKLAILFDISQENGNYLDISFYCAKFAV